MERNRLSFSPRDRGSTLGIFVLCATHGMYGELSMSVDGVNRVAKDGRYKLPPELAEKYRGEFLSVAEVDDGTITLQVVDQNE